MMKPQDILVLLNLVAMPREWSFNALALELGMSPSEGRCCLLLITPG